MKVYIVTAGDYSDYHIVRVFTDKEKAEKYVSFRNGRYDEYSVEEYDTDDVEFAQVRYFYAWYVLDEGKENFRMNFSSTTTLDESEESQQHTSYSEYSWRDHKSITIKRVIRSEIYDESVLENKYRQVCRDLYAKIKSLKELEGWDEKMVQTWLTNNKEAYIPEFE